MQVGHLQIALSGRTYFQPESLHLVPNHPGCYVLSDWNDEILYIGKTNSLHRRMGEHLNNAQQGGFTYWNNVVWFDYVLLYFHQIDQTEQALLTQHQQQTGTYPVLNLQ